MRIKFLTWLFVLASSSQMGFAQDAPKIDPLDWPHWRGPEQNGISRETGLVDKWSPAGENVLWTNKELAGRSTPIVLNGKLYTIVRDQPGTAKEGEKVICVDAKTGEKIWENRWNVFLSDVPDTRIGWSSVVGDPTTGRIYSLGVNGYFQCLDGDTGKTLWVHSMSEEYGLLSTYGGRTNFPVLFDDLVIVNAVMTGWGDYAVPTHRFVAFDKLTGDAVWITGTRPRPDDTTYSTPISAVLGGQAALTFGSGDGGVYAIQPRTGKPIWSYLFSLRGINVSPLVVGNTVYACHSEENYENTTLGAVAAIKGQLKGDITGEKGTLWRVFERTIGKSTPIIVDNRLYTIDDSAGLFIFDAKTGKQLFKKKLGTMQRGSPVYADGKIYTADNTGRCYILKPTSKGVEVIHQTRLPGETREFHASPVVSHGRIYLTSTEDFYCIGKPDHTPTSTPRPEVAVEPPVTEDQTPAHLQIVPVELLVRPGESKAFHVRVYNSKGQYLGKQEAVYTASAGTITPAGELRVPSDAKHSAINVTATIGSLKSVARVRVVPSLPWSFDFKDGEIPITWIGARYRHQIRDVDGKKMMVKITTIPKGTRSQSWMGHTDLHDYTIQADVKGSIKDKKLPDIGLIGQRYTLDMMGESQKLQLRTWPPVLEHFSKDVPFSWKPNVWYTLKLRVGVENGKGVARGKVWEKAQPEPEAWSIEYEFQVPNESGSPGLYGNATNAEIFIENIKVTPNNS